MKAVVKYMFKLVVERLYVDVILGSLLLTLNMYLATRKTYEQVLNCGPGTTICPFMVLIVE